MFEDISTQDEDEIYSKYRIYILKTLKYIALDLLQNTYAPEKSDRIGKNIIFNIKFIFKIFLFIYII